ncbi:hypothetical protein J1N35_019331 [Gossypium stocksii]|uniref:Gag-pol polyprotein n=1 Tax=Gossypium stocksii TaxID=47602 RepID=A0A9D3VR54_9ROSI|nr:hypothetical protein J1N35_019331 [Gossypium stocksii]
MPCNQSRSNSRDRCNFHNDRGHKNEGCSCFKDAIEEVVRNGELNDFMAQDAKPLGQSSGGTNKRKKKAREGNDPMVVSATIVEFEVKRILVDSGSAVKVLT